ncbi:MAG: M1 family aminopeptidase [Vicinamibacterales bacterium]
MMSLLLAAALAGPAAGDPPGRGISEALARERTSAIAAVRYELTFTIPTDRTAQVLGREVLRLSLKAPHRIVLDFLSARDRVRDVHVGGRDVAPLFGDDHLTIPAEATRAGENEIAVEFIAGDEALNRNDDFLYTLFVPARAHFAFPVFDQPDIKARYTLTLDVPAGWEAVANGPVRNGSGDEGTAAGGRRLVRFAETQPLPTYLFSFVAGKFSVETATRNGRQLRMFHRETDQSKVARNRDAIFDLHAAALAWLEEYTAIPYAFGKFDFVLIPSFQFGGMEHAGAILYNAAGLMLDESATQNQLLNRASVISHETAHMWFGDLVTMRWFNDVWMKEVFANVMAEKIVNPSFPALNHELRFFLGNYPAAYAVDRTAGANPIRQSLANLDEAGQLYGAIIYQKAPVVMRQLEMIVGEQPFRDGLRAYLRRYAFGNATWSDLIRILDARTPRNLARWSRAWVEERGRPDVSTAVRLNSAGRVSRLTLTMSDPLARGLMWPQRVQVTLGYADSTKSVPVNMTGVTTVVPGVAGMPAPLFVLPGGGGLGYGLFRLDDTSRHYLLDHLEAIADPLTRGVAWVTLWDNLLESHVSPGAFLDLALRALPMETDEQNTQRVLGYLTRAFWRFLPAAERPARAAAIEPMLRAGLDRADTSSRKSAWFSAFRDVVLTPDGLAWIERVWRREETIPGLTLAEPDEIAMALELAVRDVPSAPRILQTQLERTGNPDRKARLAFVMPAMSSDPAVREAAFDRLRLVENRRREPWALEAMQYLNHPLREAHARRFVGPGLELLREIQRTGDIFFPTRWTESLLAGHRSREVAATVEDFLAKELQYPRRLRWTVLSASDELFRAARDASSPAP